MRKAIAKVKLAPGNVAWYDSLTGIYLTIDSPEAVVYDNQDMKNIKNAIRYNLVSLREGIIPSQDEAIKEPIVKKAVKETKKEVVKEMKEIAVKPKNEFVELEAEPVKEIKQEVVQKNSSKKSKNKKTSTKETVVEESKKKDVIEE